MKKVNVLSSGIISSLGFSTDENFLALIEKKSGVQRKHFFFSEEKIPVCKIEDEQIKLVFNNAFEADVSFFTKLEQLALLSISEAVNKLDIDWKWENPRIGFIFCTVKGNVDKIQAKVPFSNQNELLLSQPAEKIASFLGLVNSPVILSNACISGLQGLIVAKRMLEQDLYDYVIVTGADVVSDFIVSGFWGLNATSTTTSKPFDDTRDGINIGEGASTIIMSTQDKFQTNIRVKTGAITNDANHITAPSRTASGLKKAIHRIMSNEPGSKIDFISSHGTGTRYNDAMEATGFSAMGFQDIPVHSLKGSVGHTFGAAGILESAIAIRSLEKNVLVPSVGFEKPGEDTSNINVITEVEHQELRTCLKTASGFGGCNAALLFEKEN